MPPNGTAVEGVCVTWRTPPVGSPGSGVGKSPGGSPGMAQFLQSRRTERVELDRYPGRAAMLSLKRFGSSLSRYNCLGMSAKNCAKQITPTDRVSICAKFKTVNGRQIFQC